MNANKSHFWIWVVLGFGAIAIMVCINWGLLRAGAQLDLTQDARYTIPPALAHIAATKIDPDDPSARLKITVYLSESLARPRARSSTSSSIRRTTWTSRRSSRRSSRSLRSRCRTSAKAR
jgi:hypothetical protein